MRRLAFMLVLLAAAAAHAEPGVSERRALIVLPSGERRVAVLLGAQAVWTSEGFGDRPVSVCMGSRCAAVTRIMACRPPLCPAHGTMLFGDQAISELPTYSPADDALMDQDPVLRRLLALPPPVYEVVEDQHHYDGVVTTHHDERFSLGEGRHFVLGMGGEVVVGSHSRLGLGGTVTLGLHYRSVPKESVLAATIGDEIGLDLRGRVLSGVLFPGRPSMTALAVGLQPILKAGWEKGHMQFPSVLSLYAPEVGLFRADQGLSGAYIAIGLPLTFFQSKHLAIELRPEFLIMTTHVDGKNVSSDMFSAHVGLVWR